MDAFETSIGVIVNRNPNYTHFRFSPLSVPVLVSVIPFFYIIPTCVIMLRIIHVYFQKGLKKKDETVNRHVFLVIILSQITCLCFFLSDFFTIRLPSTGFLTSWCQEQDPNYLLTVLFSSQPYFNYTAMMFPVLLSLVRLMPIYYPHTHWQVNAKILCTAIPLIFVYPLAFLFFMIPALGVCRQFNPPYDFGAVYLHFIGSWNQMINAPFQLSNCVFWLSLFLLSNFILHRKLRKLANCSLNVNRCARYQKAEVSLTLTTTSMILAYLTNLIFLGTFLINPSVASYAVILRPFGNDLRTCVVPWVFYKTHPAFRKKVSNSSQSKSPMNV